MSVVLTNMSVYCTESKITLLQWRIASAGPPGIIFLEFFCEKYLINNDNTRPPALCVGEASDEKLKIHKLGPYLATL